MMVIHYVSQKCSKYVANSAHGNYVKTSGKNIYPNAEGNSMFHISAQVKYTHFQTRVLTLTTSFAIN